MNFNDTAVLFDCHGDKLVGVLSLPEKPEPLAVLVIVGGAQYRAGSHRQFVRLSRRLAAAGHPVLRFDVRGMGDSSGEQRDFESLGEDIGAALAALREQVSANTRVALWGLCDGASAALMFVHERPDAGISALCLVNPWVRTTVSKARTTIKHYYTQRLRQPEFWAKLFSGQVARGALGGALHSARRAWAGGSEDAADAGQIPYAQRMAAGWKDLQGSVLLLLSGRDYTAKEFIEYTRADPCWIGLLTEPKVERHDLPLADHTLSSPQDEALAMNVTIDWLRRVSSTCSMGTAIGAAT